MILQIFARMNATGVRLNAQEIRNAEFIGRFKNTAYEIATEQLARWRDEWKIFTPDEIARMAEVELTSEFVLLIFNGVLNKSTSTINNYYAKFDSNFDDSPEVARRFRDTLDTIDELFGADTIRKLFKRRALFYALFASIYGLQYGLRKSEPLDNIKQLKRTRPNRVKPDVVQHIEKAGSTMALGEHLPDNLEQALRGATSDTGTRKTVIGFLVGKENDPCRHLN